MIKDIEEFVQQLKAENQVSIGINMDYAKKKGYADIYDALAGITEGDAEYYAASSRHDLVSHTSRYIKRLEDITYKNSYPGKMEVFRERWKEQIAQLKKETWDYDLDGVIDLAVEIEVLSGWNGHDEDDLIIIDGVRCYTDDDDLVQRVMDYLDIKYEERLLMLLLLIFFIN